MIQYSHIMIAAFLTDLIPPSIYVRANASLSIQAAEPTLTLRILLTGFTEA